MPTNTEEPSQSVNDKKRSQNRLLLSFSATVMILAGILIVLSPKRPASTRFPSPTDPAIESTPTPAPRRLAAGKQTFTIMSGPNASGPKMREVTIDPYDAEEGARQYIAVLLDDPEGITEAVVAIKTDTQETILPLTHTVGSQQEGLWTASWIINDRHDRKYSMIFTAKTGTASASAELSIR